jgi:hypothetical protein
MVSISETAKLAFTAISESFVLFVIKVCWEINSFLKSETVFSYLPL